MKAITLQQWRRMTSKQRSWVVCRALGEHVRVFWHCVLPSGSIYGGSYDTRKHCTELIETAQELTLESAQRLGVPFPHPLRNAVALPSASFPHYAEFDHLSIRLGKDILRDHGSFRLFKKSDKITAFAGGYKATGNSIEEAVCLLVLRLRRLIRANA